MGKRAIVHGSAFYEDARSAPGTIFNVWQADTGGCCRHAGWRFDMRLQGADETVFLDV